MTDYISTTNDNKFSAPRSDIFAINKIVITYTVSPIEEAVLKLFSRGNSVHYIIGADGFQNQLHNEDVKTFYAGKSCWNGLRSVNEFGIGIMLENDGTSPFTEAQISKTIALIQDINTRHDTTMEVVGLGEVAFDRHIAPGILFPWHKLAEEGIGRNVVLQADSLVLEDGESFGAGRECWFGLGASGERVVDMQQKLLDVGYCIEVDGEFDENTEKLVQVFKAHYIQDEAPEALACWNQAAEYVANELLGIANN